MGSGVSVEDPSKLRREYEALAAKNVGNQELLNHMKKLIFSPPAGKRTMSTVTAVVRRSSSSGRLKTEKRSQQISVESYTVVDVHTGIVSEFAPGENEFQSRFFPQRRKYDG